jgi:hypothetical protein
MNILEIYENFHNVDEI